MIRTSRGAARLQAALTPAAALSLLLSVAGAANAQERPAESLRIHPSSLEAPSVRGRRAPRPVDPRPAFVDGQILVRFEGAGAPPLAEREAFEQGRGYTLLGSNPWIHVYQYELPRGTSVVQAIRDLRVDPNVDFAEPNWLSYLDAIPNDGFYDNYSGVPTDLAKWVYDGIGGDRNVNAEAAWNVTTGRSDVVIAVIDSGVDLDHPDLAGNIWFNPGETPGNGLDDDGNGFVDDVNGWDFVDNNNDPNPDLGDGIDNDGFGGPDSNTFHGTFSASCAGAVGNNSVGLTGAAWDCQIMALQIFDDDGGASTTDIANAITYAANNGAHVTNMSFSGGFSSTVQSAVNYAHSQGLVQVASAGNGNSSSQGFPASLSFVISVGASDSGSVFGGGSGDIDGRASFSQYGPSAVDVVAPGSDIVGAYVNSVADGSAGTPGYVLAGGTSFSGPIVAGLACLVVSRGLDVGAGLSNDDVETILQTNTTDLPDDPGDSPNGGATWDGNGRVDFTAAVNAVPTGGNNPPVADAGPDQNGVVNQILSFDGSGSSDPDGDPLTYTWDFGDGSGPQNGAQVSHAFASAAVYSVTLTVFDGVDTDVDSLLATIDPAVGTVVHFSSRGFKNYPGLNAVFKEDLATYDSTAGTFTRFFDGSDVGLTGLTIYGLHVLPDGDLLFSFKQNTADVAGLTGGPNGTTIGDEDILRFTPTSLGPTTAGVWSFYLDGSDVELDTDGEDIDAITMTGGGALLLSVKGLLSVTGLAGGRDEDLARFTPSSLGSTTAGTWVQFFDGSDVGLSDANSEEAVAAYYAPGSNLLFVSSLGQVSPDSTNTYEDEDLMRFTPSSLGATTAGVWDLWLDFSTAGVPAATDVQSLHIE